METLIAQLDRHLRKSPVLGRDVYIAKTAVVVGDVVEGGNSLGELLDEDRELVRGGVDGARGGH
jgi:hypothetical protein